MIDLTMTMQKFSFYAGTTQEETESWRPLVVSSVQKLEALVRRDLGTRHIPLLASAAAADAYYYFCLLAGTRADSAVVAGAVTVHTDQKARVEAAKALRDNAFAAIRGLFRDDTFAFVSV